MRRIAREILGLPHGLGPDRGSVDAILNPGPDWTSKKTTRPETPAPAAPSNDQRANTPVVQQQAKTWVNAVTAQPSKAGALFCMHCGVLNLKADDDHGKRILLPDARCDGLVCKLCTRKTVLQMLQNAVPARQLL
eukprot:2053471-Rhodomonas_salina.2